MKVLRLLPTLALLISMVSLADLPTNDLVEWNEYLRVEPNSSLLDSQSDDDIIIGDYLNVGDNNYGLKTQRRPVQPPKILTLPVRPKTAADSADDLGLSAQELNYLNYNVDAYDDEPGVWNEYLSAGNAYLDADKAEAKKAKKSKSGKSKKFKKRGAGGQEVEDFEYVSVEPLIGESVDYDSQVSPSNDQSTKTGKKKKKHKKQRKAATTTQDTIDDHNFSEPYVGASVDFDAQVSPRAGGPTHKNVEGKFTYCASCKLGAIAELCPTCGKHNGSKNLDYYGDDYFSENDQANLGIQLDASGSEVTDSRHGSR